MLRSKRDEIEGAVVAYEKRLNEARANLAHVTATLRMFEASDDPASLPAYVDVGRLFKRGEVVSICFAALAQEGPLDTRELGLRVVRAKHGMEETETSITGKLAPGTFAASFLLGCLAVLEIDGIRLEDI